MTDRYAKAPITEAVIEIRSADPVSDDAVKKAERLIKKRYGKSETLTEFRVVMAPKPSQSASLAGYKLTSEDGTFVAQPRKVGLSFSVLAPYPGWTAFTDEFKALWAIWIKAVGRQRISQVGVRFLNRIDIPQVDGELIESDDYLNVGVRLIPMTQNGAETWKAHFVSHIPETRFLLRMLSGPVEGALIGHASYLLDLDLICSVDVPQTDNDIWALLDEAKLLKNRVFEECITSKTRELIS